MSDECCRPSGRKLLFRSPNTALHYGWQHEALRQPVAGLAPWASGPRCVKWKLWSKVTEAIDHEDQYKATEEKTVLEEEQRARARSGLPHQTKYFRDGGSGYQYIHAE
ncbi:hypothetical protein KIN20_020846 [Parelaphostrongylus tenuis]|uniref:Uncharacterized protein n=1 Tax=Parelaphostrongylus tenuis TaxID=148309 RepID=A0AAD5MN47_PARTN|nr:hypothetical protein KIN20_020846 [Parelaphostrongylus tenuis]